MAEPTKIKIPWARDDGSKTAIPETSQIGIVDGRASYPDGFVPLNGTPKAAGGIPPFKSDMNGILYSITNVLKWVCSGGLFKRDDTFQTAISGYPVGAVLLKADNSGIWFNTVDGNTSDPDTGGAGWQHIDPRLYAVASGTATAYTATFNPAITALADGMMLYVNTTSVGTNTNTTPTFSPNGLTARTIVNQGGFALRVGDIPVFSMLQYDLTNTRWILLNPALQGTLLNTVTITSTGANNYTPTTGAKLFKVTLVGGGAAGGGTPATSGVQASAGGGGGAGAVRIAWLTKAQLDALGYPIVVTIGAGGTGVVGANGNAGGTSSFGSLMTCNGGSSTGSVGLAVTGVNVSSSHGGNGTSTGSGVSQGSIQPTTGKVFTLSAVLTGAGGSNVLGAGGQEFNNAATGVAGSGYGAGGGGAGAYTSAAALAGGAGANGVCIIEEYA